MQNLSRRQPYIQQITLPLTQDLLCAQDEAYARSEPNKKPMSNLYLASSSQSRQQLLKDAGFMFEILRTSNEAEPFNSQASLQENVEAAAQFKATTVILPPTRTEHSCIFVITADTLIADAAGTILRKPKDLANAHNQLHLLRMGPCTIGTAFVVQKFEKTSENRWSLTTAKHNYSESSAVFHVPEEALDAYFSKLPFALYACGSGIIEGFGAQFLKSFSGSYTGALGLPVFELKEMLKKLNYNQHKRLG